MENTQLFFLSDQYFKDFPDERLMQNKENEKGIVKGRPYYLAFQDTKYSEIYWMVPISSKYEKYKIIEERIERRYGRCNVLRFGNVLGKDAVFLIQNMCPTTEDYLLPYIDKKQNPIQIDKRIAADVIKNAKIVLSMEKRGVNLIYPNVQRIYRVLEMQIQGLVAMDLSRGTDNNLVNKTSESYINDEFNYQKKESRKYQDKDREDR